MTLQIDVVTIFPELITGWASVGILGKAAEEGRVRVRALNPRDFTTDKHRSVDDAPYGGGSGMLLRAPPVLATMESADPRGAEGPRARRILLTPQGAPLTQARARALASEPHLVLVAGRYEGFDERIRAAVDEEISLGDFVLLGGEVAAVAIVEAVARLVPGVLGNEASTGDESHERGLLEYPQWTRPVDVGGLVVPEVLRSGDHAAIARFRRKEALARTWARRRDLFDRHTRDALDEELVDELRREGRLT